MAAKIYNVAYDFTNIEVNIDLVEKAGTEIQLIQTMPILEGIEEVNYKPTIERAKIYGSLRNPIDRTNGVLDYDASLTMQFYWWRYIISVANEHSVGLANIELNVAVTYFKDSQVPLFQDLLYRCAIKSPEAAFKRGADGLMQQVALDPMNVYYDGFDMLGKSIA
jgi:hypothetical protein